MPPEGYAGVGKPDRRRIVRAITGHRDGAADPLVSPDDTHLVGRGDPGEDGDVHQRGIELAVVPRIEIRAGDDAGPIQDRQLLGDGCRRRWMVTGDHHHRDTGGPKVRHCRGRGGSHAIGQAKEARSSMAPTRSSASSVRGEAGRSATAKTRIPCPASRSTKELKMPERSWERKISIICPGSGAQGGDALASIKAGADYLIFGRAIIETPDSRDAARKILKSFA